MTRDHPGSERDGGQRDRGGDRRRYAALPDRGAPEIVGRLMPGAQSARGQGEVANLARGRAVAQDRAGAIGLGCSRNQNSYLRAQFLRIKSRRGPKKAIVAVAASILTAAYYLVRDPVPYKDLGPVYLLRLDHERAAARLTQRLRNLGYEVEIKKAAA